MKIKDRLLASTGLLPSFAHLAGLRRPSVRTGGYAGARLDDGENLQQRAADDEEDARRRAADDEEGDEGDDKSDCDDVVAGARAAAARSRERGRVRAILRHPAAQQNPSLAVHLATETKLSRGAAITTLQHATETGRSSSRLSERMAAAAIPTIGVDGPRVDTRAPRGLAAQVIAALDKAQPRQARGAAAFARSVKD